MSQSRENQIRGRAGERKLEDLVDHSGMVWAKLNPDDLGTDFVVGFPVELETVDGPADIRPSAGGFVVQVKTTGRADTRVALKLSACIPLKDDLRPAVVCIAVADEEDQVTGFHFVHLIDKQLSRIVRRLREASGSQQKLNAAEITFGPEDGFVVEVSKTAVRAAFEDLLNGLTFKDYADLKHHQVSTVGYDRDRYTLQTTVRPAFTEQALEYLMGSAALPVESASLIERRFNIDMPRNPNDVLGVIPKSIKMARRPKDKGLLVFNDTSTLKSFSVHCNWHHAKLDGMAKVLLTTPVLEFRYVPGGTYYFTDVYDSDNIPLRPSEWREHCGLSAMYREPREMAVSFEGESGKNSFSFIVNLEGNPDDQRFVDLVDRFERARRVEELAQVDLLVTPNEVTSLDLALKWLADLIDGRLDRAEFESGVFPLDGEVEGSVDVLVVMPFSIGGRHLGVAARVTTVPVFYMAVEGCTLVRAVRMEFLDVAEIASPTEEGAAGFARRMLRVGKLERALFSSLVHFSATIWKAKVEEAQARA